MKFKSNQSKASAEQGVKDIRRATRRHYLTEDKIRIVLSGLRGEDSIAELCRENDIAHPTLLCQFPTIPKRPDSGHPLPVQSNASVQSTHTVQSNASVQTLDALIPARAP